MARPTPIAEICQRIAEVREELHGPRGKAHFAKALGVSPSTYNYYESGRVPPADLLVKIADAGGMDLRWLLTGQISPTPVPADHPAVARIARLLADHPNAAEPLAAFVDLLAASLAWPEKSAAGFGAPGEAAAGAMKSAPTTVPSSETRQAPSTAPAESRPAPPESPTSPGEPLAEWIAILGRSAAGVPQFWKSAADARGVTVLAEVVERHARRARRQVSPAMASEDACPTPKPVQIVALATPAADNVAEFVVAGHLKRRHGDAFAVRIDGDSMCPEIAHGDIVICSPSAPAADGLPALVQLTGQIGVTCKLYRREGQTVHLIPINERYAPQAYPAGQVAWAARVLARVRPGSQQGGGTR